MPLYDFKCDYGHLTEIMCKYSELQNSIDCPKCHHPAIQHIGANKQNFILNGDGYFKTHRDLLKFNKEKKIIGY